MKYGLIATLRKLDVLEANIGYRSEALTQCKYDNFKVDFSKST